VRLIGPNCIGIANTDPAVRLNATFGPLAPPPGNIGFSSQSGALGLAAIEYADSLGLGLSSFVSVGNKADISGNDLLNYCQSDRPPGRAQQADRRGQERSLRSRSQGHVVAHRRPAGHLRPDR
jgi:hypothetical protein